MCVVMVWKHQCNRSAKLPSPSLTALPAQGNPLDGTGNRVSKMYRHAETYWVAKSGKLMLL